MPINKIVSSKRGKAAIAAALIAAVAGGWHSYKDTSATVHPPAVILATNTLIKTWEGLVLKSHWDPYAKIYDICYGKTTINGKAVKAGMSFTKSECDAMLEDDLYSNYYAALAKKVPQYTGFPVSVQAAELSGAYNFGVGGMEGSTAMKLAKEGGSLTDDAVKATAKSNEAKKSKDTGSAASFDQQASILRAQASIKFRQSCEAQTSWNRAGGQVVQGLVRRREMGDAQRIGEAELCVSGLPQ